jgi:hypothetical protein
LGNVPNIYFESNGAYVETRNDKKVLVASGLPFVRDGAALNEVSYPEDMVLDVEGTDPSLLKNITLIRINRFLKATRIQTDLLFLIDHVARLIELQA